MMFFDKKELGMEQKFCFSCAMPLDASAPAESNHCTYCTQPDGSLKSRDEVKAAIAGWMKMWQPNLDDVNALKRADAYMHGMPAWA